MDSEELLLVEIVSEIPESAPPATGPAGSRAVATPPLTSVDVARLEAELEEGADREQVARLALRLARRYARAAALFVVNRGVVAGLHAEADGFERPIEGIMIPADAESMFVAALAGGELRLPGAKCYPMDARILRAMGRLDARDRMIVPIAIRGRVVNLLYLDNGPEPLASTSAAALRALAACVAAAYERLIVAAKRSG